MSDNRTQELTIQCPHDGTERTVVLGEGMTPVNIHAGDQMLHSVVVEADKPTTKQQLDEFRLTLGRTMRKGQLNSE